MSTSDNNNIVDSNSLKQHAYEDMRRRTDNIRPDEPKFVVPMTAEEMTAHQARENTIVQRIIAQCYADGRPVPESLLKGNK